MRGANLLFAAALVFAAASVTRAASVTDTITGNFNATGIPGGDYLWFSAVMKLGGGVNTSIVNTVYLTNQSITINDSTTSKTYNIAVADAIVTFDPSISTATTSFSGGMWHTTLGYGLSGNNLLAGAEWLVPVGALSQNDHVTASWTATFSGSQALNVNWQWSAAAYSSFNTSYSALGVKADDGYGGADHAGTPENDKSYVVGGAMGGGGSNYTGSLSSTHSESVPVGIPTPLPLAASSGLILLSGLGALKWIRRPRNHG